MHKPRITIAYRGWNSDKRIDLGGNRPNERELRVLFKMGLEQIEISRRDFIAGLKTLEMAEAAGGNDPIAWRKFIATSEGDLVQEMGRAVHCDVVAMPTANFPNARALVVGFEDPDYAEAAKVALMTLLQLHPPEETR
jgi:hypothetical protein